MERRVQIGAIIIGLLAVVVIGSFLATNTTAETITIGHVVPLTGFLSVYGVQEKEGIDLAIAEINAVSHKLI